MDKTVKIAKYTKDALKAKRIADQIKQKQKNKSKSQHMNFKLYKKNLQLHESKDTKYLQNISNIKSKSKTKLKSKSKSTSKSKSKSTSKSKSKSKTKSKSKSKNLITIKDSILKDFSLIKSDKIIIPDMMPLVQKTKSNSRVNTSKLEDKYIIAIPSYKRSDIIKTHTLAVLNRHKINPECITIFVANQEEHDIYKESVPTFLYNNIVIGTLGLKNQRNFISEYYQEGKHIVEFDDDIKSIMQLVVKRKISNKISKKNIVTGNGMGTGSGMGSKKSKSLKTIKTVKPIEDLDAFIKRAFEMCTESNIFLWGVYPLVNPHFMTYKITTDLRFIVGPMWGMINRHRTDLKLTVDEKENSERTLQFWVADGAVLRFNNIGIETKYYKNKGGMQAEGKDRKEEALKSVYYLNKMYPALTKISLNKKNGMPEIKMKRTA